MVAGYQLSQFPAVSLARFTELHSWLNPVGRGGGDMNVTEEMGGVEGGAKGEGEGEGKEKDLCHTKEDVNWQGF
jgi:hypothetical protein